MCYKPPIEETAFHTSGPLVVYLDDKEKGDSSIQKFLYGRENQNLYCLTQICHKGAQLAAVKISGGASHRNWQG
jgi:hypothetical protein